VSPSTIPRMMASSGPQDSIGGASSQSYSE
jgi:hypothetical protein